MIEKKWNNITVVFGKIGSGKTTYTIQNEIIYNNQKHLTIINDIHREYKESILDLYSKEVTNQKIEIIECFTNTMRNVKLNLNEHKKVLCVLDCYEKEDFNLLCDYVYRIGNNLFIVDEIDTYISPNSIQKEFAKILHCGRHELINLVALSRRPYCVNRLLTSQSHKLVVFPMSEIRDIKYIEDITGKPYSVENYEQLLLIPKTEKEKEHIIYKPYIYALQ